MSYLDATTGSLSDFTESVAHHLDRIATALETLVDRQVAREEREREGRDR